MTHPTDSTEKLQLCMMRSPGILSCTVCPVQRHREPATKKRLLDPVCERLRRLTCTGLTQLTSIADLLHSYVGSKLIHC